MFCICSSTQYSAERYEERTIEFAKESGIGQVDVAIVCDTTSSMSKCVRVRVSVCAVRHACNDNCACTFIQTR